MLSLLPRGEYSVQQGSFEKRFNAALLSQYLTAKDLENVKKTHFFNGRFENIYLDEKQAPLLHELKNDARNRASQIGDKPIRKLGCWFNAMGPDADTTLHSHDDGDELLSGVYYVNVPKNSGKLIIHAENEIIQHTPGEGQWVFFSPQTPHAVSKNLSDELRLSIAFNFS